MIVIASSKEDHIRERVEARGGGADLVWLYRAVAEINRYLPDDWRLMRYQNTFCVRIAGKYNFNLAGRSFLSGRGDEIVHLIFTVLELHMFDLGDIETQAWFGVDENEIKKFKKTVPRPNLYYFSPQFRYTGHDSPVWARQYEKRCPGKEYEYHRLHPLTRDGLDQGISIWTRWDNKAGEIKRVSEPEADFHGEDYWRLRDLSESNLMGNADERLGIYEKRLQEVAKVSPATEDHARVTEYEYKFITIDTHKKPSSEEIIKEIEKNNYNRTESIQTEIEDAYLDTKTNFLGQNDFTLRLRKVTLSGESHYILQFKKRVPGIKTGYKRTKLELPLTKDQAKNLMTQGLLPRRFEELLGFILPTRHSLQPAFHVKISRDITLFENVAEVGQRLELRTDNVVFLDSNALDELGTHQEIEIENRSADPKQVGNLISQLEEKLQLLPISQTKNDRGRFLLRSKQVLAKKPRKVIIDTDCGVDDALALIMAIGSPELKVEAVTTVSGNVHIKKVNLNVFKVFRALGLNHDNIPLVAEGAFTPLDKSFSGAPSVHGKDGLGDVPDEAPPVVKLHSMTAEELIPHLAAQSPKEITLITLGPLTNVARAIRRYPGKMCQLKEIVCMGGAFFEAGNVASDAEFNIYCDPKAAQEVLEFSRSSYLEEFPEGPVPLTFVGLDVTHKVRLHRKVLRKIKNRFPSPLLDFVWDIAQKYMDFYRDNEGLDGCYLHDPLAVGYVINPAFCEVETHHAEVETLGRFTEGMIVPDDRPTRIFKRKERIVTQVCRNVEAMAFEEFLIKTLVQQRQEPSSTLQ